jgi:carbon-monoxide dehydrogenase small subunit
MSLNCRLQINGADREVNVEGNETLLSVLRETLSLLGSKRGCNQGVCGACTVLMDGLPVRACLSLAANCEGRAITTVEALESDALGRRLQDALVEHGAVQCGFCTAGMLMAAHGLLTANPQPNVEEIRVGLSGNICRCTGYRKIIDAVKEVSESK